jgi:hypothetical protein
MRVRKAKTLPTIVPISAGFVRGSPLPESLGCVLPGSADVTVGALLAPVLPTPGTFVSDESPAAAEPVVVLTALKMVGVGPQPQLGVVMDAPRLAER